MGQAKIYKCDHCGDTISDENRGIQNEYINLKIGGDSGWVEPNEEFEGWYSHRNIERGRYDFCSVECVAGYLEAKKEQENARYE